MRQEGWLSAPAEAGDCLVSVADALSISDTCMSAPRRVSAELELTDEHVLMACV